MKKFRLLILALVLTVAACGGGDDEAALPVNDGAEPPPAAAGACFEEEPECDDTPGGEPQDLPPPGDDAATGGMVIGGGLSVADALQTDATGIIAVQGFLVDRGGDARLCEALAESFPPQCGGESIPLDSIDQIDPDELTSEGDVTWTDQPVTLLGELIDGVFVATELSQ